MRSRTAFWEKKERNIHIQEYTTYILKTVPIYVKHVKNPFLPVTISSKAIVVGLAFQKRLMVKYATSQTAHMEWFVLKFYVTAAGGISDMSFQMAPLHLNEDIAWTLQAWILNHRKPIFTY